MTTGELDLGGGTYAYLCEKCGYGRVIVFSGSNIQPPYICSKCLRPQTTTKEEPKIQTKSILKCFYCNHTWEIATKTKYGEHHKFYCPECHKPSKLKYNRYDTTKELENEYSKYWVRGSSRQPHADYLSR